VVPRLFGVETEYALTALDERGRSLDRGQVIDDLMRRARAALPHLPDEFSSGMFLQNGARFYVDAGHHPEVTTPEVSSPWDVVRYIRAGERLLAELGAGGTRRRGGRQVLFFRCNVDYAGAGTTWGCHESYMHTADPEGLPAQIIPHLVSRLIYTGAGGFDSLSAGIELTLSPRVPHLTREVSTESTHSRGIFHTKDEPLSGGPYRRLHLLCGESLCSQLASWLKTGTTALVVAMIEAGLRPGDAVALPAPLAAMQTFAGDPTCTATVASLSGNHLTALAIQRHYLTLAEAHAGDPFMPPWAAAVCEQWRAILQRLERGPDAVTTTLDWAIKLALYKDRTRRRGFAWESLPLWTRIVDGLMRGLPRVGGRRPRLTVDQVLDPRGPVAEEVNQLRPFMQDHGLSWNCLRPFLELRQELFEVDIRFGQLGDAGIFTRLDAAGALAHRVAGADNIEHAMTNPPDVPRARRRGELVRQLSGNDDRYTCDWQGIWDAQGRMIDLSDPFGEAAEWTPCPGGVGSVRRMHGLLQRALRSASGRSQARETG